MRGHVGSKSEIKALRTIVGARCKLAREALQMSQAEAAAAIGTSVMFYARIERGGALPSIETLAALARALRASPDALIGRVNVPAGNGDYNRYRATPEQRERRKLIQIERHVRAASPETLRALTRILDALEAVAPGMAPREPAVPRKPRGGA